MEAIFYDVAKYQRIGHVMMLIARQTSILSNRIFHHPYSNFFEQMIDEVIFSFLGVRLCESNCLFCWILCSFCSLVINRHLIQILKWRNDVKKNKQFTCETDKTSSGKLNLWSSSILELSQITMSNCEYLTLFSLPMNATMFEFTCTVTYLSSPPALSSVCS